MSDQLEFTFDLAPGRVKPTRLNTAEVAIKSAKADRGKKTENEVHKLLKAWEAAQPCREFNRLIDTRAAGRVVKAAAADFDFFQGPTRQRHGSQHGLIEVKEVKHDFRLPVKNVSQLPRLVRRAQCGGYCVVLIFHSTTKLWRAVPALYLHENRDGASWDLRGQPTYPSARIAMQDLYPSVFTFGGHE